MLTTTCRLALICVCLFTTTSRAAILSVDFNGSRGASVGTTYTGNGVLRADGSTDVTVATGTPTGHWDGITFSDPNTPNQSSGLLNSGGGGTPATISFANWGFQDNCPGCADAGPSQNPANQALLNDYIGQNNFSNPLAPPTLTIGGLGANNLYDLIIYSTNGGTGAGGTWSVNGSAMQETLGGGGAFPFVAYANAQDYVEFSVLSNALGQLVVTGSAGGGGYAILNGFQLSPAPVPEPSALILWGLGALGLFFATRRRKA